MFSARPATAGAAGALGGGFACGRGPACRTQRRGEEPAATISCKSETTSESCRRACPDVMMSAHRGWLPSRQPVPASPVVPQSSACVPICLPACRVAAAAGARPGRRRRGRRLRRRCGAAAPAAAAPALGERQIRQQREPHARDLHVARGLRAIGLRLLQQQPRVGQLELRRQAFAIAQLGDLVGALRLLHGAGGRFPRGARVGELQPASTRRRAWPARASAAAAPASRRGRRARDDFVRLDAAAGEDRHLRGRADRPVGAEVVRTSAGVVG